MSLDLTLLRLCSTRERFNRLVPNAENASEGLDKTTVQVLGLLRAYYSEFPDSKAVEFSTFKAWANEFKMKKLGEDDKSLLNVIIDRMKDPVPPELEQGMVERLLQLEMAARSISSVIRWQEGAEFDLQAELAGLSEEIAVRMDRKARLPLVRESPEELMKMDEDNVGITWRLKCLRDSMRPLRGGDFGIYAMRPDAGKTTFLASETSHWITQLDRVWPGQNRTGIWLNNEGPGRRIKQRWYQSALGATVPEMVDWAKDGSLTKRIRDAMGCDLTRMMFFDVHEFTSGEVEAIIKESNPGFIVFDMIDNIRFSGEVGNGGQRTDQVLESMYQSARNWCVKYDAIGVAASQVSGDGDGLPYPTQTMLKDSKTGKQGACDFIIMGGKLNDPAMEQFRYMGAPKNKLHRPGGKKDPRAEIYMDAERARFNDPEE